MVGDPELRGEARLFQGELSNTAEMLPDSSGVTWLASSGERMKGGMAGNGGMAEGEGARPDDTLGEGAAEAGDSRRQGERRLGDGTAAAAGGSLTGSSGGALQQPAAGKRVSPAASQVASSEASSEAWSETRCRASEGLGGSSKRDCDGEVLGLASAVGVGTSAGNGEQRVGAKTSIANGEQRVGASGKTRPLVEMGVVASESGVLWLRPVVTAVEAPEAGAALAGDFLRSLDPRRRCLRRSATWRLADADRRQGKMALGRNAFSTDAP